MFSMGRHEYGEHIQTKDTIDNPLRQSCSSISASVARSGSVYPTLESRVSAERALDIEKIQGNDEQIADEREVLSVAAPLAERRTSEGKSEKELTELILCEGQDGDGGQSNSIKLHMLGQTGQTAPWRSTTEMKVCSQENSLLLQVLHDALSGGPV